MTVALLGVTFLLAAFFPVGSLLALYSGALSPAAVKSIPPVLVPARVLLVVGVVKMLLSAAPAKALGQSGYSAVSPSQA